MRRGEVFPKLEQPVVVPMGETFVARATLDRPQAEETIRRAVLEGPLRPFDIASADVEAPHLLWVPFWRMEVAVDGFFVHLERKAGQRLPVPVPTGATRYKDAVVMICARKAVPYAPKLPSMFGRVVGPAPLEVAKEDLNPRQPDDDGADVEIVDADIDRAHAEGLLTGLLLESVSPTHVLYPRYEPKLTDVRFCLYPLYCARYTYSGEARRRPGEELIVAVSARTGQIAFATYPSVARSVAAKVRRLLSFDFR